MYSILLDYVSTLVHVDNARSWSSCGTLQPLPSSSSSSSLLALPSASVHLNPWEHFFAGYVVLGNLSLTYNDVGFYQLVEVMTTPTVVLINFVLF
jgi:hypothetical protein